MTNSKDDIAGSLGTMMDSLGVLSKEKEIRLEKRPVVGSELEDCINQNIYGLLCKPTLTAGQLSLLATLMVNRKPR